MSRDKRVNRGANLVMATGVSAIAFAITLILAVFGVIGFGVVWLTLIFTGVFGFGAYRIIKR